LRDRVLARARVAARALSIIITPPRFIVVAHGVAVPVPVHDVTKKH
jgi:hypothetical protein